jgi:hypothetical protein
MNGSNHQEEKDHRPLYPVCLRKHCWDSQVEPVTYLTGLKDDCEQNGLGPEREWCE